MFEWIVLLSVLLPAIVGGKECPSDSELRKIIEEVTVNVDTSQLAGTWMDVVIPEQYLENVKSSFTVYKAEEDEKTVKLTGHDFLKSGEVTEYTCTFKKKGPGVKGGEFTFEGTIFEGDEFKRDVYFFYIDRNVIGFYSCHPDKKLEVGWDVFILVNADKKKALQEQKETSEVTKSLKKAKAVMKSIKEQSDLWLEKNKVTFGLMGTMKEFDLNLLQSEISKDSAVTGSLLNQDKNADEIDQNKKIENDVHSSDLPAKDIGETIQSQNNAYPKKKESDDNKAQINTQVSPSSPENIVATQEKHNKITSSQQGTKSDSNNMKDKFSI